jgi:hypothetical protein
MPHPFRTLYQTALHDTVRGGVPPRIGQFESSCSYSSTGGMQSIIPTLKCADSDTLLCARWLAFLLIIYRVPDLEWNLSTAPCTALDVQPGASPPWRNREHVRTASLTSLLGKESGR